MPLDLVDAPPQGDVDLATVNADDLTFAQVEQMLEEDVVYEEARAFYEGDHWQGGDAWIGPIPDPGEQHGEETMADIEQILVPHPGVEEVVNRGRDAVIAHEPRWNIALSRPLADGEDPSQDEQDRIDEAEAFLTDWWDDAETLEVLQQVVEDIMLGGRGVLRLLVPEGQLTVSEEGDSLVPDGPIEEQLRRIFPTFIRANQGAVVRDPRTMERIGAFIYERVEPVTRATHQFAELTYLDAQGRTVIRTVGQAGNQPLGAESLPPRWVCDLDRHLMMFEARSRRLVTVPVLQNQKLATLGCTMLGRNVVLGGFLERVILNGQVPGEWVTDEQTGKERYVPEAYRVGAGTTTWVQGMETGQAEDGTVKVATPEIRWRDPVRTVTFEKTIAVAHLNILSAARQVHALISGDATASGESRKQARDDFLKSLTRTKSRVDAMGRWLLETVLTLAAYFAGTPDRYQDLRVTFECQLDIGPISAEDRKAGLLEVAAEIRSRENYMEYADVTDDTEAEKGIIRAELAEFGSVTAAQETGAQKKQLPPDLQGNQNPASNQPAAPPLVPPPGAVAGAASNGAGGGTAA